MAVVWEFVRFIGLQGDGGSGTTYWQGIIMRAYPPSGVMPSVSFGAVQLVYPILSISPNPATYGQSITITSTCVISLA